MPVDNIHQRFLCPITKKIMRCPVLALDGYVYEREAIQGWLAAYGTSYVLNIPMQSYLVATIPIELEIQAFLQNQPDKKAECFYYLPNQWKKALEIAIKHNNMREIGFWIQLEQRLLTCHIKNDYTAFHYACEVASLENTYALLFHYGSKIVQIAKMSQPNTWKPYHLNDLLAQARVIGEPTCIEALKELGAVEEIHVDNSSEKKAVVANSYQQLNNEQTNRGETMKKSDSISVMRKELTTSTAGSFSPAQTIEAEALTECRYETPANNSAHRLSYIKIVLLRICLML